MDQTSNVVAGALPGPEAHVQGVQGEVCCAGPVDTCQPTIILPKTVLDALDRYRRDVSRFYDEVVDEAAERASQTGSIGKAGIGSPIAWKRLSAGNTLGKQIDANL